VSNWTQNPFPVAPWDALGLPPRTLEERCARHKHCAYRDDDPNRCPICHATPAKCRGEHGVMPFDGWGGRGDGPVRGHSPVLEQGQYFDPRKQAQLNGLYAPAPGDASEHVPSTPDKTLQEIAA
jgi:hypothetical protein